MKQGCSQPTRLSQTKAPSAPRRVHNHGLRFHAPCLSTSAIAACKRQAGKGLLAPSLPFFHRDPIGRALMNSLPSKSKRLIRSSALLLFAIASMLGLISQDLTAATSSNVARMPHPTVVELPQQVLVPSSADRSLPFGLLLRIALFVGLGIAAWDLGRIAFAQERAATPEAQLRHPSSPERLPRQNRSVVERHSDSRRNTTHRAGNVESLVPRTARKRVALAPASTRVKSNQNADSNSPSVKASSPPIPATRSATVSLKPTSAVRVASRNTPSTSASVPKASDRSSISAAPTNQPTSTAPSRRTSAFGVSDVFQRILEDNTAVLNAIERGLVQ